MRRPPAMDRRRLLLLLLLLAAAAAAAAADKQALLDFKRSVSTDPAGLLALWIDSPDSYYCSWPGVSCNAASRVTSLNISAATPFRRSSSLRRSSPDESRRLLGNLSPALGNLSELRILSLPFHRFRGGISVVIWRLQKLELLDLEGSSLSGTLPSVFPPALAVLNLASNRIHGEIPEPLSRCRNLEILDVSGNRLGGSIPGLIGELGNLRRLDLSANMLVGGIPGNLGNCSKLESLILFSNLLDGSIPSDIGRLAKLRVLDVSRNSLSGRIPAAIGRCTELAVVVLSNPDDSVAAEEVRGYADSGEFNYFEGRIPESVTALPKLRVLWAPRGMLVGGIPSNWSKCESLEMVNLGHNLLSGQIPDGLRQCKNLKYLNLSSNRLVGFVNEQLVVPCMDVFDVSGNLLTGFIPLFTYKSCTTWELPDDDLTSAYYKFFAYRSRARSSVTPFKSDSGFAVYHDFGQNKFSGTLGSLPLATEKYGNRTVYAFLADGNYLYGELNDLKLDKCNAITGLIANFSNNLISGGIPVEIGRACKTLIVLDVAGNQITEALPHSLGLLGSLSVLDMSRNQLTGMIPSSFGGLKRLEYLSLAHNNMSGQFPTGLVRLHSLKVLDLSSNILTGEVPRGLVYLRNLTTLLLNNNKLSGKIPSGLTNATSLSMFNFSFNNLSGPLPVNSGRMSCDMVLGNPLLQTCYGVSLSLPPPNLQEQSGDSQIYPDPPSESPPTSSGTSGFSSIEIASIASAAAIFSVLVTLVLLYVCTKKCFPRSLGPSYRRREVIVFMDIGVPLTYEGVVQATGCFNASNCIGSGGFGATYKAEVSPGVMVAIKRLSIGRLHGIQQFHAEVKTLGRWRHPNLVTLIGYHLSDAEMFLVYNYLPGGNLERFIHERSRRLVDWRMLHKIAVDVARALAYLHDHCVPRILHRDVKPSNILLDNDYNAYLSDFGLARLLGNSETHATTGVAGTFGYVAPEYAMTCRVSDKADVYSYGVVILELISDKKALDPSFSPYGNGFNIVTWASMLLRQGRAREVFNEAVWDMGPHDDLVETLHLAVKCTDDSLSIRPTMKQVVRRLKELQPLPV